MIEVNNIYKKFGKNEVLKGIDLNIDQKGVFAVLGPNGSGKTTLIKCILGMVLPNEGTIKVDGESIARNWEYRRKRSEEHTSELQSRGHLVCRLLLEKKK